MKVNPYQVEWTQNRLDSVLGRIHDWRQPPAPEGSGWAYGTDAKYLATLRDYWLNDYDAQAAVSNLNLWPQFRAKIDEHEIHFIHVIGEAGGRRPLMLIHGWPSSHFEFWPLIERLAFPSKSGGRPEDAFDVVIPSLPGYGFSSKPSHLIGPSKTAELFDRLMRDGLNYPRYLVQGGDWGAGVASAIGLQHPDSLAGIHITMLTLPAEGGAQTDAERKWIKRAQRLPQTLSAYQQLQSSKPQSLVWAMADNPMAQASWIVERFHDWADLRQRSFQDVFSFDNVLTNIMIYVMEDAFSTSVWFYRGEVEERLANSGQRMKCTVPTGIANFHGEPLYNPPPRTWADRAYNIVRWTDFPEGGHFAAAEQPELLLEDVRGWARDLKF